MLNLPEIVPIETVLAMAKIPFDNAKTAEPSHLQTKAAGSAFSKIQRRLRRAKPTIASSLHHKQKAQDEPLWGVKIRFDDCWKPSPANAKVIIGGGNAVKTAESRLQTKAAGSAFSKIQRRLRRAKPNTSPSTQDEASGIKIRLKDWKTDPANVKVIISDGNAEQPCSEPSLFKGASEETPQTDQKRKQSNFTLRLPQRKVGSIVVPNQNQS